MLPLRCKGGILSVECDMQKTVAVRRKRGKRIYVTAFRNTTTWSKKTT